MSVECLYRATGHFHQDICPLGHSSPGTITPVSFDNITYFKSESKPCEI